MQFTMVGVILMKSKLMFIIIGLSVLVFVACKGNDQETNFIPTQPPAFTEDDLDLSEDDDTSLIVEPTDTPDDEEEESVSLGETTTMYVKLATYGAILNVRSAPTTEEDNVVGFLVHTEPVEVISIENGFASFIYKDDVCYVSEDFLSDTVPPYISPPV